MSLTLTILAAVMSISIMISIYWNILNYRRLKLNRLISAELTDIIDQTTKTIQTAKKNTATMGPGVTGAMAEAPELLATMVTVLVHKYGDTRLEMIDFMIADSEYVSVYVDTATQEIVLSLNHDLGPDDTEETMMGFGPSDDNIFH